MEMRFDKTIDAFKAVLEAVKDLRPIEITALLGMVMDYWQEQNGLQFEETQELLQYVIESRKAVLETCGPAAP